MSQFRVLVGVLRGGGTGPSQLQRGCGGALARLRVVPRRGFTSRTEPLLPAAASSSSYVEEMYFAWLEDHKNVHEVTDWAAFIPSKK